MSSANEPAPFVRVAAYAIARDDGGRMLLVRVAPGYSAVGKWTLPGGGLNFGEDPAHAAVRELEEETGYIGAIEQLAFVASWTRASIADEGYGPFQAIQIVYEVRITGGELRHELDESSDMAAWFTLDEIAELPIVDLVAKALEHVKATDGAFAD